MRSAVFPRLPREQEALELGSSRFVPVALSWKHDAFSLQLVSVSHCALDVTGKMSGSLSSARNLPTCLEGAFRFWHEGILV